MHGLGDSADGWTDAAQMLARSLKHVKFIIPTASPIPVTLNGGMRMNAWYDITGTICLHLFTIYVSRRLKHLFTTYTSLYRPISRSCSRKL